MPRSIVELAPEQVLGLAVAVETRNAQRYDSFALMFQGYNAEVSRLFSEMRDEELQHRRILEDMYRSRYGDKPYDIDESDVDEVVEAVDIDDGEQLIFDSMTRRNVLESALRAEQGAQRFYASLCETVKDEGLLALYRSLAANEDDHVEAVLARMEKGA